MLYPETKTFSWVSMMELWIIDLGVANQPFNMAPVHKIPVSFSFFYTLDWQAWRIETKHAKF